MSLAAQAFVSPKATFFLVLPKKKAKMRVKGLCPLTTPFECRDRFRRGVRRVAGSTRRGGFGGFNQSLLFQRRWQAKPAGGFLVIATGEESSVSFADSSFEKGAQGRRPTPPARALHLSLMHSGTICVKSRRHSSPPAEAEAGVFCLLCKKSKDEIVKRNSVSLYAYFLGTFWGKTKKVPRPQAIPCQKAQEAK